MGRRAARRDANEAEIVTALRAAGASVAIMPNGDGFPDLLVGLDGRDVKMEVKLPLGPRGGKRGGGSTRPGEGGDGTLTADQIKWWSKWRGSPPVIVRTQAEALAAIGVIPNLDPRMSRFPARIEWNEWRLLYEGNWTRRHGVWDLAVDASGRGPARWGVENLGGEATRPAASAEAAMAAADAWAAAHQDDEQAIAANVAHRDLNPDNMPAAPAKARQ